MPYQGTYTCKYHGTWYGHTIWYHFVCHTVHGGMHMGGTNVPMVHMYLHVYHGTYTCTMYYVRTLYHGTILVEYHWYTCTRTLVLWPYHGSEYVHVYVHVYVRIRVLYHGTYMCTYTCTYTCTYYLKNDLKYKHHGTRVRTVPWYHGTKWYSSTYHGTRVRGNPRKNRVASQ